MPVIDHNLKGWGQRKSETVQGGEILGFGLRRSSFRRFRGRGSLSMMFAQFESGLETKNDIEYYRLMSRKHNSLSASVRLDCTKFLWDIYAFDVIEVGEAANTRNGLAR